METISTIVAAITGGLIAGIFSICSVKTTLKEQWRHTEINRYQLLLGFSNSILNEMKTLVDRYWTSYGETISELKDGSYLNYTFPVSQNYFSVYDRSTNLLGTIDSPELLEEIIHSYTLMKGIVEDLNTHNQILEKYDHYSREHSDFANTSEKEIDIIVDFDQRMRDGHKGYINIINSCISNLQKHCTAVKKNLENLESGDRKRMAKDNNDVDQNEEKFVINTLWLALILWAPAVLCPLISYYNVLNFFPSEAIETWFQRSGSITVLFIAASEYTLSRAGSHIELNGIGLSKQVRLQQKYEGKYKFLKFGGFIIGIIGTLIWGYGDLLR